MTEKCNVVRDLGSYEMMHYMRDQLTSCNFSIYSDLRGKITKAALKNALAIVQKRHPLLRVKVVKKSWWAASYAEGQALQIPLRVVTAEKKEVIQYLEVEQAGKFDISRGPLMRCLLLRHGEDESTLILTFNHICADATSGVYVARDIIKIAGLERTDQIPDIPVLVLLKPMEAYLPWSSRGVAGLFNFLRHLRYLLNASAKAEKNRLPQPDGKALLKDQKGFIISRTVNSELLEKVTAASKKYKTTLHCAILSAYTFAMLADTAVDKPADCVVGYDYNRRKNLKPSVGEDMGVFLSFLMSNHVVSSNPGKSDFWKLAKEIESEKVKSISNKGLVAIPYLNKVLRAIYFLFGTGEAGLNMYDKVLGEHCYIGVTNVGRIDIPPQYGNLTIRNMAFTVHWGPMILTATTFLDQMTLNIIAMKPVYTKDHVSKIADFMIQMLKKNCE